jgi:predicted MFS family arabinose efflux permease
LDNPWWIVAGSVTALAFSLGTINTCMSLFVKPLQAEFGWDRATISGAKGAASLVTAFALMAFGWMIDRWGVRRVVIPAMLAFGLSVGLMSQIHGLVWLVSLQILVGLTGAGYSPLGFLKSVSAFIDSRRGLATGIVVTGTGVGNMFVPQVGQWFITHYGWRAGYLGLAAMICLIGVPVAFLFVRDPAIRPKAPSANPKDKSADLPGHTVGESLRSRTFWTIAAVLALTAPAANGALFHIVPMLTDRGISPAVAASGLAAYGFTTILGRLGGGWAFDRWFAPRVIAPLLVLAAIGLFLIRTDAFAVFGIACLGIATGAELNMIAFLLSRYFGLKKQAQLSSILFAVFTFGLAAGEYGYGLFHTLFHSYNNAIFVASGLLTAAAALTLTLGPYAYPAEGARRPTARGKEQAAAV